MSVVHVIDTVTEWARDNICSGIKLKQPPADLEAPTDEGYAYTLVTPAAFAMYVPTSEKLPPSIHSPFPSLCVRLVSGQDEQAIGKGFADVQLCFSTWDTGLHDKDLYYPMPDGSFRRGSTEGYENFVRNGDGWRDAWNFVDIALRAVESVSNIGGFVVDKTTPVKYGPLTEQEAIPDLYPTWFAWVSFRVNYPLVRNNEDFNNFL